MCCHGGANLNFRQWQPAYPYVNLGWRYTEPSQRYGQESGRTGRQISVREQDQRPGLRYDKIGQCCLRQRRQFGEDGLTLAHTGYELSPSSLARNRKKGKRKQDQLATWACCSCRSIPDSLLPVFKSTPPPKDHANAALPRRFHPHPPPPAK